MRMIQKIGANGDLVSKARESLVSFQRMLMYVQQASNVTLSQDQRGRFKSTLRDVQSLSDHATFLGSKIQFLLDAVLGLINLEQNNIIKIFSVAAVMFLPPTLVASIYGMNFHFMPELDKYWGYPMRAGRDGGVRRRALHLLPAQGLAVAARDAGRRS